MQMANGSNPFVPPTALKCFGNIVIRPLEDEIALRRYRFLRIKKAKKHSVLGMLLW